MLLSENRFAFHMVKTLYNWSKDLIVCTNGQSVITAEEKALLKQKNIQVFEQKITALVGNQGLLERVVFEDREEVLRQGGFVTPQWSQANSFAEVLGCKTNEMGGIITDGFGRSRVEGVYAAGDASVIAPAQLIIAAAEGSRAAIGVNSDLTQMDFI